MSMANLKASGWDVLDGGAAFFSFDGSHTLRDEAFGISERT